MTSQGNIEPFETKLISSNIRHTEEGVSIFDCHYGRTSLNFSQKEDCEIETSIFSFDSIQEAKDYAIPLHFFHKNMYVNDVLFVNEPIAGSGTDKFEVVVKRIRKDMKSFIDTEIEKMSKREQDYWYKHVGPGFKVMFRHLTKAIVIIISQRRKHFEIPKLMDSGVISISENEPPKFTKLTELNDLANVNRNLTVNDLGATMDYFLMRGAINMPETLSRRDKMQRLNVPAPLAKFIYTCKYWPNTVQIQEPIEWLLDSSTLWPSEVTVEWVIRLSDMVVHWRKNIVLKQELDEAMSRRFITSWKIYLPTSGPINDVVQKCNKILDEYEKKQGPNYKRFEFHNLVKFFRHMFIHYLENGKKVDDSRILYVVERCYVRAGGLCNILRDVITDVFCCGQIHFVKETWKDLMSSQFVRIVRDNEEVVTEEDEGN